MNLQDYKLLLQQTETVTTDQTVALQILLKQYPYLQSAYAMRLKGLYNENSYQYNHTLKLAAAYTTDRTVLFDFITSNDFAKVTNSATSHEEIETSSPKVEIQEIVRQEVVEIKPRKQSIVDSIESAEFALEVSKVIDQTSKGDETSSPEKSDVEILKAEKSTAEELNLENNSTEEFSIEDTLAEGQPTKSDVVSSKEVSVEAELGTPLEFSSSEKHSFKEWLQLSKAQPIIREEIIEEQEQLSELDLEKIKKTDLSDRLIIASPKIPPVKSDTKIPVIRDSPADTSALMTETLARVYLEQNKFQKAIQAEQILIMKYPEKSSCFADRISDIKKIQQNN